MFPRTIENWIKIGRNVPILRHQSGRIVPCGDGHSSDEKSPVNQRGAPICGKNGCVFQFPQKTHAETDLPQG